MRKSIVIALVTISFSNPGQSFAQETSYGLGSSLKNSLILYFPIDLDTLSIEPFVFIRDRDITPQGASLIPINVSSSMIVGIEVFKNNAMPNNTSTYYGARFGYTQSENNHGSFSGALSSSSKNQEDGFYITPTFGAQYFLVKNISIGIDLAFNYTKTDGARVMNLESTTSDTKSSHYGTEANLIIRYMF
jgi:hypothetical protein